MSPLAIASGQRLSVALGERERRGGENAAGEADAVADQLGGRRRLGCAAHVGADGLTTCTSAQSNLAQRVEERHVLEHERHTEDHVPDGEVRYLRGTEYSSQRLLDRDRKATDEHGQRAEQRPEVAFAAVPERMRLVGLPDAQPDADCQEDLDGDVGASRERLSNERRRARDDRGDRERSRLEDLRRERDEDDAARARDGHRAARARSLEAGRRTVTRHEPRLNAFDTRPCLASRATTLF